MGLKYRGKSLLSSIGDSSHVEDHCLLLTPEQKPIFFEATLQHLSVSIKVFIKDTRLYAVVFTTDSEVV